MSHPREKHFRFIGASILALSLTFLPGVTPLAFARPLKCEDLPHLFQIYAQNHYSSRQIDDSAHKRIIDTYLKSLDPSKTTLLEEDIELLRKKVTTFTKSIKEDQCNTLNEVRNLAISRTREIEEFVTKTLGNSYKFNENTEVILNPEKRGYPKNVDERNALMTRMVHFQISNYLLADTSLAEAKRLLKKRYVLSTKRATEKKQSDYLAGYLEAFAQALDPHSSFMPQDVLEDFQIHMQLSLEGIGASLSSEDGYTIIEDLIPGGAADKLKILRPKDKIIAVAQDTADPVSVIDMDLREVVKQIRGKKGTKVRLSILRQGEKTEQFQITIVRDKIDLKESAAKLTIETRSIGDTTYRYGLIDLPSFYGGAKGEGRNSYEDVKNLLTEAHEKKVDGIILDLSRNGGGLLDQAVKIGGLFIGKGPIVATKTTGGKVEILSDDDPGIAYSGPLVILMSRISASASEILAGALKDYKRAIVIGGDHSFGKGTVQVLANLPEQLGAMKVTTGMFFLPGGESTQLQGVPSDIVLPSLYNTDDVGEKKLDYALEHQKIPPFFSKEANPSDPSQRWKQVESKVIAKLADDAQKRVDKNEKFTQIKKDIEESRKNKGVVNLAEIRKKTNDDKKNGRKVFKKGSKELKAEKEKPEDNPYLQEGITVLADMIHLLKNK